MRLDQVEVFVLDEADRMLDMGFIHDIRAIVAKLPARRQTLFFSATMPREIAELANGMLRDPVRVAVTPEATTVEQVDQRIIHVDRAGKPALLVEVLRQETIDRALVFTRTKHGADKVVRALGKSGVAAEAIHGNKSQGQRERVLAAFRAGKVRTLVATDIAARGIDVDGISHVVNYDLPNIPESYVHRIGRTARAGADGVAISFCDGEERAYLRDIEKLIRMSIPATDRRSDRRPAAEPRSNGAAHGKPPQRPHQGRDRKHDDRRQQNGKQTVSVTKAAARKVAPRSTESAARTASGTRAAGTRAASAQATRVRGRTSSGPGISHRATIALLRRMTARSLRSRSCSSRGAGRIATPAARRSSRAPLIRIRIGEKCMAKEELLEFDGTVTEVLPDGNYRVTLDNEHQILAYMSGKMRKFRIRTGVGDRVIVEVSPYDLSRGRINFRHKSRARRRSRAGAPPEFPAALRAAACYRAWRFHSLSPRPERAMTGPSADSPAAEVDSKRSIRSCWKSWSAR